MTGYESIPDFVDWTQPINWGDPLNFGLVAKYLAVEGGGYGGSKWLDLCGKNNGTLTNMTSGYGWQGSQGRHGGWGSMRFDGSDDVVAVSSTSNLPSGSAARTFVCWAYIESYVNHVNMALMEQRSSGGQSFTLLVSLLSSTYYLFTDSANPANNITISGSEVPQAGRWNQIVFVFSGASAWTYYLNGVQTKTGSFGVAINTNAAAPSLNLGRRIYGASGTLTGKLDDISIYNRALSSAEVAGLYEASMSHYPTQLNRFAYRRRYVTVGGFNPAWAAHSTITLQPGICA